MRLTSESTAEPSVTEAKSIPSANEGLQTPSNEDLIFVDERKVLDAVPLPIRKQGKPRRVVGEKKALKNQGNQDPKAGPALAPYIFFSSLTGTTEAHAKAVLQDLQSSQQLSSAILSPMLYDLSYIDYDDFFVSAPQLPNAAPFYLLLLPSYNIDTQLNVFLAHLDETHHDFRIDTAPLAGLAGYAVFGFGDREGWPTEAEGFCSQAREVDRWMAKLTGRKRAFPLGLGDVKSDAAERLIEWRQGVEEVMRTIAQEGGLGEGVPGSGDPLESDEEDVAEEGIQPSKGKKRPKMNKLSSSVGDVEDLGGQISSISASASPLPIDFTTTSPSAAQTQLKPMVPVSSPTHVSLTKQGYTIVGTHSGVKLCRWTKSALRGRGSCYKFSFYGIASHQCMETTPSLSCSNKCVFCWRHGTNPVGTTWRWQVDPPELIFEGAKKGHYQKIKMLRGVPGVRAQRFAEAQQIRHCALSLVGEPIFYPHINAFLDLLHGERISSFLVCNAQHPDHLARLQAVTQLYVSIDASNEDALRRVDRPLHRDFWARFLRCLDILAARRTTMRTVFRLTLVKGFNLDAEAEGYAALVARGRPCFIEVKGVTYCGTASSQSAGLTMQNVPFWAEVQAFVEKLNAALARKGLSYGMAAEHAHSCCALLAHTNFRVNGRWRTLIDYQRFFELLESGEVFGPEDYVGDETPEWALWGNGGFNPEDQRVDRKGRPIEV